MNNSKAVIGIDTSNYTTSVAIMTLEGKMIANLKQPLPVKAGERGLRQSDAVFFHTVNIPTLMSKAREYLSELEIVAVGVSERPRNVEGSYMPCFLVGVSVAESMAAALKVPLYRFSHQCGHIMAALYSSARYDLLESPFAAFHISGGTTELVRAEIAECGFAVELVGETSDLNAGQIIDRVGVYMGLPFPSGAHIERLALENDKKIPHRRISRSGMNVNFSGVENLAKKLYDDTADKPLVSAFVLDYVGRAIMEMSAAFEEKYGRSAFVYAGGVMSNSIIKKMLSERFDASFAVPELSADNAVGVAALALRSAKNKKYGH